MSWVIRVLFLSLAFATLGCKPTGSTKSPRQEPRVSVHGAWSVFAADTGSTRKCWVASTPAFGTIDRKKTFLTYEVGKKEVSLIFQGADRPASDGYALIAGDAYAMYFRGNQGWMKSARLDRTISNAMTRHNQMSIGTGAEQMTFMLNGFEAAALDAARRCGVSAFHPLHAG